MHAIMLTLGLLIADEVASGNIDERRAANPHEAANQLVAVPELADVIVDLLERSPTFQRQRQRLAQFRHVHVRVELDPAGSYPRGRFDRRAEAIIQRYQFGRIEATLRLWSRLDAAELIAHELEHVLEYAEGADFRARALMAAREVWMPLDGCYETARAIAVGRDVAREMARGSGGGRAGR